METLISAYNPDYSEKASILTGKVGIRVTVEVEDTIDVAFWKDVLCVQYPEKEFHFSPYRTIKKKDGDVQSRGKSLIMAMVENLSADHIACVDSDYDWLLSKYTDNGRKIVSNKYLLQTYAYSIENLMCEPTSLNVMLEEVTEEKTSFDFISYFRHLSNIVYPLLVWSLYLLSKGNQEFSQTAWVRVLPNENMVPNDSLDKIRTEVNDLVNQFSLNYPSDKDALIKFESLLLEKGVCKDNAFLFIRGHNLMSHLQNIFLRNEYIRLANIHYDAIKKLNSDHSKEMLFAYSKRIKSLDDLLMHNYRYKPFTFLYEKIAQDANNLYI